MYKGDPCSPRVDNIHRFLGGIYFSFGVIAVWMAKTIQVQTTLIYLTSITIGIGAGGRILSIIDYGLPEPKIAFLAYVTSEIIFPIIIVIAQITTDNIRLAVMNQKA